MQKLCYNYCNHVVIYTKAVCLFILKQYVICNINLFVFVYKRSEERHELGESSWGKSAKKGGRGRKTARGSGVTRGKVRERSPAGRRPTVRRAGGKGRLVAEPNC